MTEQKKAIKQFNKILDTIGCDMGSPDLRKDDVYETVLSDLISTALPMLEWKGLPESIDIRKFTLYRQMNGYSIFFRDKGSLYDSFGGIGGEPDAYYDPTIATIANPYLKLSKSFTIGKDCVLDRHDYLMTGLLPWHRLYASEITEAMMTIRLGLINARAEFIINAEDDSQATGAKEFLHTLMKGEELAFIANPSFLQKDSNQTLPYSQNSINTIRSGIEAIQYLYSKWSSGIGLETSFNIKREYVNTDQSSLGEDAIRPKMDLILESAKDTCKSLKAIFGLDVSVDFSSTWKKKVIEPEQEEKKDDTEREDKDKEDNVTE